MNFYYLIAAALSAVTALAHIALGGAELVPVLEASGLNAYEVTLSLMLFHITTILLLVNSAFLVFAGLGRDRAGAVLLIGITYGLIGVVFLWQGISRLGTAWDMPQWLVLGLICGALVLGGRFEKRRAQDVTGGEPG